MRNPYRPGVLRKTIQPFYIRMLSYTIIMKRLFIIYVNFKPSHCLFPIFQYYPVFLKFFYVTLHDFFVEPLDNIFTQFVCVHSTLLLCRFLQLRGNLFSNLWFIFNPMLTRVIEGGRNINDFLLHLGKEQFPGWKWWINWWMLRSMCYSYCVHQVHSREYLPRDELGCSKEEYLPNIDFLLIYSLKSNSCYQIHLSNIRLKFRIIPSWQ